VISDALIACMYALHSSDSWAALGKRAAGSPAHWRGFPLDLWAGRRRGAAGLARDA